MGGDHVGSFLSEGVLIDRVIMGKVVAAVNLLGYTNENPWSGKLGKLLKWWSILDG